MAKTAVSAEALTAVFFAPKNVFSVLSKVEGYETGISCPFPLERGNRNDEGRKIARGCVAAQGYGIWRNRGRAWIVCEHGEVVLPPPSAAGRDGVRGVRCADRTNARTEAQAVLLGCVPECVVERASFAREAESRADSHLRWLRPGVRGVWPCLAQVLQPRLLCRASVWRAS